MKLNAVKDIIVYLFSIASTVAVFIALGALLFFSAQREKKEAQELYEQNGPQINFARSLNAAYHSHLCEPSGDCVVLMNNSSVGSSGSQAWSVRAWCNDQVCQLADIDYTSNGTCQY